MRRCFAFIALLPGVGGTGTFAQLAVVPATPPTALRQAATDLGRRYSTGVVAVAGNRLITVAEVLAALEPTLASLPAETLGQPGFAERLSRLEDHAIQQRIDRAVAIDQFRQAGSRQIPVADVEAILSERLATEFGGSRAALLTRLRSQGKTLQDYRAGIEDELILQSLQAQQPR
jgi:hypothetical protein